MAFRREHFNLRGYGPLFAQSPFCKLVHEEIYDPYPKNPAYKHDYILAVVQKTSA